MVENIRKSKYKRTQLNPLRELYYEIKGNTSLSERELLYDNYNLNERFSEYIDWKIKNKQLIKIQLKGQVRLGKSTAGCKLMSTINNRLVKHGLRKHFNPVKFIFPDQTSFLRFVQSGERNICVLIDEYNKMSESGANATTEKNILTDHSNRFAAHYQHAVMCSTVDTIDHLSEVTLVILRPDFENKFTRFKVLYKDPSDYFFQPVMLGWIDIHVGDILKTKWYEYYMKIKHERLNLMDKYGISDERPMESADYVIDLYRKMKVQCSFHDPNVGLVKSKLELLKLKKKRQQLQSIVYDGEIVTKAYSLLKQTYFLNVLRRKKNKSQDMIDTIDQTEKDIKEELAYHISLVDAKREYDDIKLRYESEYSKLYEVK